MVAPWLNFRRAQATQTLLLLTLFYFSLRRDLPAQVLLLSRGFLGADEGVHVVLIYEHAAGIHEVRQGRVGVL